MGVDGLTQAVREQLGLGRLLPLGGDGDGAWITERAAGAALSAAAADVIGVRLGTVHIGPDGPGGATPDEAPLGALGPGPLRVEAAFEAAPHRPLPHAADRLRRTLAAAAHFLGLRVTAIDLLVTGLYEEEEEPAGGRTTMRGPLAKAPEGDPVGAAETGAPGAGPVAAAAAGVAGVTRLTSRLGGPGSGVRVKDLAEPAARHVQLQIAVAPGHRALDVARAARDAAATAAGPDAPGPVSAVVLVTDVG